MAANVGNLFGASDFNNVVAKINKVLGDDGVDEQVGYGRIVRSSTVDSDTLITAALMQNLYDDLIQAREHQRGTSVTWDTSPDGLNAPDAGEYIGAFAADIGPTNSSDATTDEDEGFLDFEQAAQDILDDIYDVGGDQTSFQTLETVTRTTSWNGTITTVADIVFTNANERRYFFNSGGYIQFNASLTGGNSVAGDQTATYPDNPAYQKDEIWQTMLNTMGSIRFGRSSTTNTGTGTAQAIGNYDLTGSYQTIFQKDGSGVYSENYYKIEAYALATNQIRFRITFVDSDLGDNRDVDAGFPGEGTPVDENVTGTITSTMSSRAATGSLGIDHPGSVVISDLSGSPTISYVLTANNTSVNEGASVTISLATTGISNGTTLPYTITGVSTSDISLSSLTGTFTMLNNAASLTFAIESDLTTETIETLNLALNNGQASIDINIADTSQTPVPPPPSVSVDAWPTTILPNWGTASISIGNDNTYFSCGAAAVINITNDVSNSRISVGAGTATTADDFSGNPSPFDTTTSGAGLIAYSGYTNPTIEYRFVELNRQIDSVPYVNSTGPANSGTWTTIPSGDSAALTWNAVEIPYNPFSVNTMGSQGATVATITNTSVYFEVRISEPGLTTVTRTSPVTTVNLSADIYTGTN